MRRKRSAEEAEVHTQSYPSGSLGVPNHEFRRILLIISLPMCYVVERMGPEIFDCKLGISIAGLLSSNLVSLC